MKQETFTPVKSAVSFPAVEEEILRFWKENAVFQRSLDRTKDGKAYVFYDGPPFATGLPHYGHLLAGTLKDIIPRYRTMRGNYVSRRFGWDCHGLPVENEMEKEFKVSGKRHIEKMGVHFFNEACRSIVLRYTSQWEKVVDRMGRWVDFVNQYRTMDPPYMESIWWVFKRIWNQGLIHQGFRVQPYCPRCATPLSNFEMNEGYKDVSGPSITVSFPIAGDEKTKILVWTTTPWTLPSNVALAVGPKIMYVKIRDLHDNIYLCAKDRLSAYYKNESDYVIIEELPGSALVGMRYIPLFDYFAKNISPDFFQVTAADFVSTEDGTGIVHIAPAFGEDDFQVGLALKLPLVCPVDEEGKFTDEVPDYKGKLVFEADDQIIRDIKNRGRLVQRGTIQHRYPFCSRCDTPLMYKAITTWFLNVAPLKAAMLEGNRHIHWVPSHLQTGRFGKGIESAPDWNISRNRYWGTPLPVWICPGCGHQECVGSTGELHALAGEGDCDKGKRLHAGAARAVETALASESRSIVAGNNIDPVWAERLEKTVIDPLDLHRHVIDGLEIRCPKCGAVMTRTPEVLDCWFESGSMPYAQVHYPFENKERFEAGFPADFIAEGLDQTRGWFYTLTVLAAALFNKPAFKNVIVNGIILAEDGKKLSKRLKNYAPPVELLDRLGADALRLFLINSPAVKAEDLKFSEKGVLEMSRAVLIPFWNAYSFFVTYANVDGWKPTTGDAPAGGTELDRWIVSLLHDTIASVNREMEEYNLYKTVPLLVDFIDNLTNWYIRRSRRRFWKSENDADKDRAYHTLYYVLVEFSKVMAPFLPFLTEAIYRNLVVGKLPGAPESVHLADYPHERSGNIIDADLETAMRLVREIVGIGRTIRSKHLLKTRQPLAECTVIMRDPANLAIVKPMDALIREELNVKRVVFGDDEESVATISAKANFKALGKVYGPKMKEAAAIIEKFMPAQIRALEEGQTIEVAGRMVGVDGIEIRRAKREGVEVETGSCMTVALETTLTLALKHEGLAREFVNRVQNMRKDADFNVSDRILVYYECDADTTDLIGAVTAFADHIKSETLAIDLVCGTDDGAAKQEACEIEECKVVIGISKVVSRQ
jgi:isoleucyl-tRNA synthetase